MVSLPLESQGSLPVLLCDDPVLAWLILVWKAGEEVSHCPAEHHLSRGSPTVLHWSIPELHHSSHKPVRVQCAPRPNIVPQQSLARLHSKFGPAVGVRVIGGTQAMADTPGLQALLEHL